MVFNTNKTGYWRTYLFCYMHICVKFFLLSPDPEVNRLRSKSTLIPELDFGILEMFCHKFLCFNASSCIVLSPKFTDNDSKFGRLLNAKTKKY